MSQIILSTAYFPNIQYLSKFLKYDNVLIEHMDTYAKQSFRNRCIISSANGPLPLSVPVVKNFRTSVKDIQIDYSEEWQKKQHKAILSAYKNSAFYDYYFPEFEDFFIKKEKYLIDLNLKILDTLLDNFGIGRNYTITEDFIKDIECDDLRDRIHPKASKNIIDPSFKQLRYYQVFSDKSDFTSNLSSLDLLFNEGPVGLQILENSIVK